MKENSVMRALVVVESWFGNTAQIAEAIADGLREAGAEVEVTTAASAPHEPVADLIVVAAPPTTSACPRRPAGTRPKREVGPGRRPEYGSGSSRPAPRQPD